MDLAKHSWKIKRKYLLPREIQKTYKFGWRKNENRIKWVKKDTYWRKDEN